MFARVNLKRSVKFFSGARFNSLLVIAEHDQKALSLSTYSAINAAKQIGGEISVLVLGSGADSVSKEAAGLGGIAKVLTVNSDKFSKATGEMMSSKPMVDLCKNYSHVLSPSSNHGKNYVPRIAALLNSSPLAEVMGVVDANTFVRPMYAGNAITTIKMNCSPKFLLIRSTAFDKTVEGGGSAAVEAISMDDAALVSGSTFISESTNKSERPDLGSARVVVSGGRGMKNGENFAMLEKLADKLGGAVGASRAAVDAGFVPNDYQVGQTGKVVAPDLYIAVGISGAIQHLSGMKDSKTIVAINKDKEAPIFQVSDYGIVDDLFKVIPELTDKV